jgi:HEAT repeat protein
MVQLFLTVPWAQETTPAPSQNREQSVPAVSENARPTTPHSKEPVAETLASAPPNSYKDAWKILESGCTRDKTADRANATRVLGLVNDGKAVTVAEKALSDPKPEVRVAAAAALGDMRSKRSISKLKGALHDEDPSVALAAANSLRLMHNETAYKVYSEVLSGERKGSPGLIASERSTFSDPEKLAELGFEEAIGFVPFASIGWRAIKEVSKDDSSPVRAAAAKVLAEDPNPAATKLLERAAGDESWIVRAAALEALARRGDPSALKTVRRYLLDEKDVVRYTAAASTLRLSEIKKRKADLRNKPTRQ